jgi:hypothetical protein
MQNFKELTEIDLKKLDWPERRKLAQNSAHR